VSVPTESVSAPAHPPATARPRRPRRRWLVPTAAGVVLAVGAAVVLLPADDGMPRGDLPGWRQVFTDDFDVDAPLGGFYDDPHYDERWSGYEDLQDTSGAGTYRTNDVLSVSDGVLDMWLRTEDGVPLAAAPVPLVDGVWGGQLYGRFEVRFRADPVAGYKMAWLLWPDSDVWAEGEVDWPEGPLDGEMYAANLQVGSPGEFALVTDPVAPFGDWHVATTEWTPDGVTFFLDGEQVGSSDVSPSTPMHWVLQTETAGGTPPAESEGHVQVDWVAIYQRA
jgi:glycosyl hydrolase family 16